MSEGAALVVGLGNAGPAYVGNRHNVGALVADVLADRAGGRFSRHKSRGGARSEVLQARLSGRLVVLAKPVSYMNEVGGPVAGLCAYFGVLSADLVVVHDELDLPYGGVRGKLGGGDNGHNGLRSLRRSLGTGDYLRVRVGIGRPPGRQSPADFVLRDFSAAERKELDLHLADAADAVEQLLDGVDPAIVGHSA